ncbi:conserved hypothetical protein [Neorickettsia risticii str. Illinois]|uniref:Uncharacterized protein n=1 Tax=Neorickettsia risticii (strain Illinois) TaxID=434131 RepID=C6V5F2_NEORI|nr:conserved hypothetical protein [Neorickettsia risticii str. Illinois]
MRLPRRPKSISRTDKIEPRGSLAPCVRKKQEQIENYTQLLLNLHVNKPLEEQNSLLGEFQPHKLTLRGDPRSSNPFYCFAPFLDI